MTDTFDYVTYFDLLGRLCRSHRACRFADLDAGDPGEAFFLLRHDVDYSPEAALRLAGLEAARGIRATYFLLPHAPYYNLLAPEHAGFPARLVALGHEVGLHYDVRSFQPFPRASWRERLDLQARLLGQLAGEPVRAIAMHQPALHGDDPFRAAAGYHNAYDDRFFRDMTYLSDSCRAWRDRAWELLAGGEPPPRFQLVLHPINWGERDRDRVSIFAGVHHDLQASIAAAGVELLERIAEHAGVREHEGRERARRAAAAAAAG